jgi:hypothetical protein
MTWGILLCAAPAAWATDIAGVQPAAYDQPQIHALFRTSANGTPIEGTDILGNDSYDIQGFLDTGTSGVLLSQEAAGRFGFNPSTYNGTTVTFSDVGVGGTEDFSVSDPYYISMAYFGSENNINFLGDAPPLSAYTQTFGPVRTQISNLPADSLLGEFDIYGMPILAGKVAVFDPKPDNGGDSMRSYIYNPGTPFDAVNANINPGIPQTDHHVQLSYASFDRFTQVTPAGAPGPSSAENPFIGPNPLHKLDPSIPAGTAPPVDISWGGHSTSGSFLFDSGASASFISTALAADLHVHYQDGTYNTDNPILLDDEGNPIPNQFVIPLGGIGGSLNAAGFFLDSMTLSTVEGDPINYLGAPVLVADITVEDALTGGMMTLDGDFGVNFWVASTDLELQNSAAGPYSWVTFDQPNGLLGFQFNPETVPEPSSALLLAVPLMYALGIRRRRA